MLENASPRLEYFSVLNENKFRVNNSASSEKLWETVCLGPNLLNDNQSRSSRKSGELKQVTHYLMRIRS